MGLIEFILLACILGVLAWAVTTYLPMPESVKALVVAAVVLVLVLILVRAMVGDVLIPRFR
jgi:hypothetical protein